MGILDKIGLKKKASEKPHAKEEAKKSEGEVTKQATPISSAVGKRKIKTARAYGILVKPILSEKGAHLATGGKYVFAVHESANKPEIKKSIEMIYNVQVKTVRIVSIPGKMRRYGRSFGSTSAWKKAIVTVQKGEKIPGIIESVG